MSKQRARRKGRSTTTQTKSSRKSSKEDHASNETHKAMMAKEDEVTYVSMCLKDASREELIETILYTMRKADKRKDEFKTLRVELANTKDENKILNEQVKSSKTIYTKYVQENHELRKENDGLKDLLENKTTECDELTKEVTELKNLCMTACASTSSHSIDKASYDDLMTNYDMLLAENARLKSTITKLQTKESKHAIPT